MPVPRIIHQIWMQGWDVVPDKFADNIRTLEESHPDYIFMRWDEEGLRNECRRLGADVADRFDSYKYMMSRVDLGRYVVLYNYGGISVDLDMKPLGNIDETPGLAEHDFLISGAAYPANSLSLVNNAVLLVRPRHPVLRQIIDEIVSNPAKESTYLTKELFIHNTTGPLFMSGAVRRYGDKIYILDHRYYEPCLSVNPYCEVDGASIMDHQHELSWMADWMKVLFRAFFWSLEHWVVVLLSLTIVIYSIFWLSQGFQKRR